ncbi:MAG: FIST N-terminal domain-containing protein [Bacteroidales bacterium]
MKIQLIDTGGPTALARALEQLEQEEGMQTILVLACDGDGYEPGNLDPILTNRKIPVYGGVFPALIHQDKKLETGIILVGLEFAPAPVLIEELSTSGIDLEGKMMEVSSSLLSSRSLLVFVDGFSRRISKLIDGLFTIYGLEFNYIGGGAGSLSLQQKPCIITPRGLLKDCAILLGLPMVSGIGVQHGWTPIAGPFRVSAAKGNVVQELDHKPAFEVYKLYVEKHSGQTLTPENFFSIAKAYPFGITKIGAEKIVRDPIAVGEDDSLICVGEVERGAFLDLLHGQKERLISAAGLAAQKAKKNLGDSPGEFVVFIDCISRVLYLEEDFDRELEEVSLQNDLPLFGALTIGEIANNGKDYLEFYNKTSVIGCF